MLRGVGRLMARASSAAATQPSAPGIISAASARSLASAAPHLSASTVPAIIAAAAASSPLKDAAKFYGINSSTAGEAALPEDGGLPSKGVQLWTFTDLDSHTRALSVGLCEAGFSAGDKIAVCLPPESQEYITLLLAAANCGVTVVAIAPPASAAAVELEPIEVALAKYKPRGLFIWHGYRAAGGGGIVPALFPDAAGADAAGVAGFSPLSGRSLESADHPYLQYVVHTSDAHVRGATSFKSLLVYSGEAPVQSSSGNSTVLVEASSGREVTHRALLADARDIGKKLDLVDDVYARNGKVVVRPLASVEAAAAAVSALMHESLLISTNSAEATTTAKMENALVM